VHDCAERAIAFFFLLLNFIMPPGRVGPTVRYCSASDGGPVERVRARRSADGAACIVRAGGSPLDGLILRQAQDEAFSEIFMPTAHDQVEALLDQLRARAKDPEIDLLSGRISLLCRGYMEPAEEEVLPGARLTPNERSILGLLQARLGRIVTRGALLDAASFHHGWGREPMPKIIDVYICRLRRKLVGSGLAIETVWGSGYRMVRVDAAAHASTGSA
jgi:DNA-binding response OmpR family regulator